MSAAGPPPISIVLKVMLQTGFLDFILSSLLVGSLNDFSFYMRFRDTSLRQPVTRKQLASCFLVQLDAMRKLETMKETMTESQ